MSGYYRLLDLDKLAVGLNIEGYRPAENLAKSCKWFNIVQVIDEPISGVTFDDIMIKVKKNNYEYIEQAIGLDIPKFINQLTQIICDIKKDHKNVLVHVHQFENSTILSKTLHEKIKDIKIIIDKTHYYEHPVNYKIDYPNIDALISISQCAGFGLKAGTWIIPNSFMNFDVKNNIIYTDLKYVGINNHVEKYIKFDYIKGNILVVDDLWNPNLKMQDGVLLLDKHDIEVLSFVKENTKIFDDSHNWQHAIKVAYNATKILNNKFVLYLALLHDVCDHKYKNSISREILSKYICNNLPEYKMIDTMIEMISFSKQKSFERVNPIIEAVRDADRLEAIGKIGLQRCIQFVTINGGSVPKDVIQHCYDKLLKIVPNGYIVTKIGLHNAISEHNIIVQYVRDHIQTTDLIYKLPEFLSIVQE
jgi:uncharacterized protein